MTQGIRVANGSDIEQIYRAEGDRLYFALLAYSGDPEIAREAVAESFARALASRSSIRQVAPWVWKVAFRVAAAELKRRDPPVDPTATQEGSSPEPHELVEALAQLSERQRASIILHYYAGYSLDEIAAILGIRKGTIGTHLHRGRTRLLELLEEDDD